MADQVMLDAGDVDKDVAFGELQLSFQEREVLQLYDRLEELKLEASYLKAMQSFATDTHDTPVSEADIEKAKAQLLEAKAHYNLRNSIIDSVLIANPILQAIHAGSSSTIVERDLLPLVQARDNLSISMTSTSAQISSLRDKLITTKIENQRAAKENVEVAARMMKLAEEANTQKKEDIRDPEVRARFEEAEVELRESRQRWRMMKGMTSAVVAGSGVDWARDEELRALVLDAEDDDEDDGR